MEYGSIAWWSVGDEVIDLNSVVERGREDLGESAVWWGIKNETK
jgi:hypothetical protein